MRAACVARRCKNIVCRNPPIIKTFRNSAEIGRLFVVRRSAAKEISQTAMFVYILSGLNIKVKPAVGTSGAFLVE